MFIITEVPRRYGPHSICQDAGWDMTKSYAGGAGWERKFLVHKEEGGIKFLRALITKAAAKCCGLNTIEGMLVNKEEAPEFWKTIREYPFPAFNMNDLIYLQHEAHANEVSLPWLKPIQWEVMCLYQSASEPSHKTAFMRLDFRKTK